MMPMAMVCPGCGTALVTKLASIPEHIICYKAGDPDPNVSGNRIVTEWHCPVGGVVYSPGGGIVRSDYGNTMPCNLRSGLGGHIVIGSFSTMTMGNLNTSPSLIYDMTHSGFMTTFPQDTKGK